MFPEYGDSCMGSWVEGEMPRKRAAHRAPSWSGERGDYIVAATLVRSPNL